jgi:hypothetical protein
MYGIERNRFIRNAAKMFMTQVAIHPEYNAINPYRYSTASVFGINKI